MTDPKHRKLEEMQRSKTRMQNDRAKTKKISLVKSFLHFEL